jgi:hypothetical protein
MLRSQVLAVCALEGLFPASQMEQAAKFAPLANSPIREPLVKIAQKALMLKLLAPARVYCVLMDSILQGQVQFPHRIVQFVSTVISASRHQYSVKSVQH